MSTLESLGINKLTPAERLTLLHDIWDSLSTEAESAPISDSHRAEVDRRLAAHRANPTAAVPWEEIEAAALSRVEQ